LSPKRERVVVRENGVDRFRSREYATDLQAAGMGHQEGVTADGLPYFVVRSSFHWAKRTGRGIGGAKLGFASMTLIRQ
jgi:hypothetical protein